MKKFVLLVLVAGGSFGTFGFSYPPEVEEISIKIETWKDLKEILTERYGEEFATLFTKISIYESGWEYDTYISNNLNNVFAFICNPKCECDKSGYAKFNSKEESLEFLDWWINYAPPKENENLIDWLERRKYNTENPEYYQYLNQIII
jgi:hypothetical protein